jgi:hypothetical protein
LNLKVGGHGGIQKKKKNNPKKTLQSRAVCDTTFYCPNAVMKAAK